jgi:hypothetical protein
VLSHRFSMFFASYPQMTPCRFVARGEMCSGRRESAFVSAKQPSTPPVAILDLGWGLRER